MTQQKKPNLWVVLVGGLVLLWIAAVIGAVAAFDDKPIGAGATYAGLVVGGLGTILTLLGVVALGVSLGVRHSKFD